MQNYLKIELNLKENNFFKTRTKTKKMYENQVIITKLDKSGVKATHSAKLRENGTKFAKIRDSGEKLRNNVNMNLKNRKITLKYEKLKKLKQN